MYIIINTHIDSKEYRIVHNLSVAKEIAKTWILEGYASTDINVYELGTQFNVMYSDVWFQPVEKK